MMTPPPPVTTTMTWTTPTSCHPQHSPGHCLKMTTTFSQPQHHLAPWLCVPMSPSPSIVDTAITHTHISVNDATTMLPESMMPPLHSYIIYIYCTVFFFRINVNLLTILNKLSDKRIQMDRDNGLASLTYLTGLTGPISVIGLANLTSLIGLTGLSL